MKKQEQVPVVEQQEDLPLDLLATIAARFVAIRLSEKPTQTPDYKTSVMHARYLLYECVKQLANHRDARELFQQAQPRFDALAALRQEKLGELGTKYAKGMLWWKVLLYITGKRSTTDAWPVYKRWVLHNESRGRRTLYTATVQVSDDLEGTTGHQQTTDEVGRLQKLVRDSRQQKSPGQKSVCTDFEWLVDAQIGFTAWYRYENIPAQRSKAAKRRAAR